MAQFLVWYAVHSKSLGQLKVEDTVRAAVGDGDLAVFHLGAHVGLGRLLAYPIPDLVALGRLHRQVDRVVEVPPVAVADHRVAVFHRGFTGGPHGIAHLAGDLLCDGTCVGLDAHVLRGGDGHIKGAGVAIERSPLVLGVVPQAVPDSCATLRRDFHGFGAAFGLIINLGDGVDVRRGNRRIKGKWLTEEASAGLIIIVSDAVAPRRDIQKTAVHRTICAVGILIGIQPAVAQVHDRTVLQVLDGVGVLAVCGQLRGHQHNTVSARGADVVRLLKGQILIGVAGLLGHALVPLHAVAHIAQGRPVRHGVTHRYQHHILLNVGEGLGGARPACAVPAALRVQGVVPAEERALPRRRGQLQFIALAHDMSVLVLRLYDLGKVDAAGSSRRYLMIHDQSAGHLHGGHAGGRPDVVELAAVVFRAVFLHSLIGAVALIHIRPQHDLLREDRPAVFLLIHPCLDAGRFGVDGHPLLRADQLHLRVFPGFDVGIRVVVVRMQCIGFGIADDVALVPDIEVALGVHLQGGAVPAPQQDVGHHVLFGYDLHRGLAQHLHGSGGNGPVLLDLGYTLCPVLGLRVKVPPGFDGDLQGGVVLHLEIFDIDAERPVAVKAAGAAGDLDVHIGASPIILKGQAARKDDAARIILALIPPHGIDVQLAAAADRQLCALTAVNGVASAGRLRGLGKVQRKTLAGIDFELRIRAVLQVQKDIVSAHDDVVNHPDKDGLLGRVAHGVAQIDPHVLQVAIEVQDPLVIPHKVVALLVGDAAPHISARIALGDVLAAAQFDRPRLVIQRGKVQHHIAVGIIRRPSRSRRCFSDRRSLRLDRSLRVRQGLGTVRCLRRRRRLRRGRTLRFCLNIGFCQCFVHGLRLIKRRGRRVCAACRGDRYGRQRHHGEHQKHR